MSDTSYAVIQLQGKQYKVSEGDQLVVDRLPDEAGNTLKITDVLLVSAGKKLSIGTPLVAKATVTLEVVDHKKGDKIRVATYKSKSRYRRTYGHRQHLTTLTVTKIAA
jgi:large subunit ribosomal protein L21